MHRLLMLSALASTLYGCATAHLAPASVSHDFGTVPVGSSRADPAGVRWANTGQKDIRISSLGLSGADAARFWSYPRTMIGPVRPGETTQPVVSFVFVPLRRGRHVATLTPLVDDGTAGRREPQRHGGIRL